MLAHTFYGHRQLAGRAFLLDSFYVGCRLVPWPLLLHFVFDLDFDSVMATLGTLVMTGCQSKFTHLCARCAVPKVTAMLLPLRVVAVRGVFAREIAAWRFGYFFLATRHSNFGLLTETCDVLGLVARVAGASVATTWTLVVTTS